MTPLSIALRVAVGLGIVAAVVVAGVQQRHVLVILPLTLAFGVLYVLGKWPLWVELARREGLFAASRAAVLTLVPQLAVVAALYAVGFGIGALVHGSAAMRAFGPNDVVYAVWVVGLGGLGAALATRSEARAGLGADDLDAARALEKLIEASTPSGPGAAGAAPGDGGFLDDAPVTLRNVFREDGQRRPPADEAELAAAAARMGIALPNELLTLYRTADGGETRALLVPTHPEPAPVPEHWTDAFPGQVLHGLAEIEHVALASDERVAVHRALLAGLDDLWILARYGPSILALAPTEGGDVEVVVHDLSLSSGRAPARFRSFGAFVRALRGVTVSV